MTRSLFAVILTEGKEKGAKKLLDAYDGSQIYTALGDNVFIIADDTLTGDIAKTAGLTKDQAGEGIRGTVLKLNGSLAGYTRQTFWEWLENVEGRA